MAAKRLIVATATATAAAWGLTKVKPLQNTSLVWDVDGTLIRSIKIKKDKKRIDVLKISGPFGPIKAALRRRPSFTIYDPDVGADTYNTYMRPFAHVVVRSLEALGAKQHVNTLATRDYAEIVLDKSGLKKYMRVVFTRDDIVVSDSEASYHKRRLYDRLVRSIETGDYSTWAPDVNADTMKEYLEGVPIKGTSNNDKIRKFVNDRYDAYSLSRKQCAKIHHVGKDIDQFGIETDRRLLIDDSDYAIQNLRKESIKIRPYDGGRFDAELLRIFAKIIVTEMSPRIERA